ncbi:PecA family PE domain-processing aspartic protease [Mycobacterium sp. Marseille-P9652]|uniref:PecA family PE domain-processing aspartic protease n=1 Tax=Mycobacterium sp. Marseille-P9652 TaxID=2654950 RepID=UPI0012E9459B|nr:PecA family PE domain-processing aspartic protease [Mycobacterium sp. Marseille-P9652]
MSFLVAPPEITSALLHSGAGSGPMLATAAAWDGLADELGSAAQSFSSVTSDLASAAWQGPASAAMLSTATRYAGALSEAAAQAQTAAVQAQTVASAFESALAATVHPAAVAANRNGLIQLVVSNLFGQNAPAIAAVEADYEQMWAQDVAAMIGYHGGVSAAASGLGSWSTALQGVSGQLTSAAAAAPAASLLDPVNTVLGAIPGGQFVYGIEQNVLGLINAPTEILFGFPLIPTGPAAVLGGNGATGQVPLTMYAGTEPLVNASVGTGAPVPLLVDTGSQGLVIPFQKVGGLLGMLELGIPIGGGISGYSGGLDYVYLTYNAPVNFGGGLVTTPTPVDVEIFAFPTTLSSALNNGFTFQSFFAADGASGVLGIGPNATGPGPSVPTAALPGTLGQGVLVNEVGTPTSGPYLQFGGQPGTNGLYTNTGGPYVPATTSVTLPGAPITNLDVKVNGVNHPGVPSIVDTGGVFGTLPSGLNAQPGDLIQVYDASGTHLLYQYNYNVNYSPTPISSGLMNTGYLPFSTQPAYISNVNNTTTFYQ